MFLCISTTVNSTMFQGCLNKSQERLGRLQGASSGVRRIFEGFRVSGGVPRVLMGVSDNPKGFQGLPRDLMDI